MRRLRAWGTLGLSLVALAPHPCPADVSRLSPKPLSVWRDEGGREIAKLISPRLLFLYTWDSSGRVVHIEAFTGSFDPQSRTIPPRGEPLWKHLFLYGEGGNLIGEQDCRGEFHPLDPKGRFQVDPDRGTALRGIIPELRT